MFSTGLSANAFKMSATPSVNRKQIDELLAFIQPLAVKAGELLMEGYTGGENVDIKSEFYDVVTAYDHKIEQFLMKEITAVYPDHKFVAEEEVAKTDSTPQLTDTPTWIIDPIDGTSNFIKMLPHTCVSIGLAINKQVVLGVVNNPVTKNFYTTAIGQGAFRNGERIRVSDCKELKNANIGYEVSLLHATPLRDKHIKRIYHLGAAARRMVSYASVVESLCYVATGQLDAYPIDDMYPWDCAAASLLIREAGGVIYHPYGGEFQVMKPDLVAAGTESLCQEVMAIIQRADKTKSVGGDST